MRRSGDNCTFNRNTSKPFSYLQNITSKVLSRCTAALPRQMGTTGDKMFAKRRKKQINHSSLALIRRKTKIAASDC